jgi:hypothetical protein
MIKVTSMGFTQIQLGLDRRIAALRDMRPQLEAAAEVVYAATRERFDSRGNGQWAPLADSTVARKTAGGAVQPDRVLFEMGDLYESATSPTGPYSSMVLPTDHAVVLAINWEEDGYQIPQVLSQGAGDGGAFPGRGKWHIPPRPIWPPPEELVVEIGEILMTALRGV